MMNHPQGKINVPTNNATVSRHFQAEGTVEHLPAGQHLFLVVEIDGLLWPKGEVQLKNTAWTCEVHEGGSPPDGRFALSLFLVSGKDYDDINSWLERGKLTDDYPGFENIKNGERLHSVKLRLAS